MRWELAQDVPANARTNATVSQARVRTDRVTHGNAAGGTPRAAGYWA
ncbi:hypothetical protein ACXR2W_08830 [Leucobacter sp. HY1908]